MQSSGLHRTQNAGTGGYRLLKARRLCLNQGWHAAISLVDDFSITLGVHDPQASSPCKAEKTSAWSYSCLRALPCPECYKDAAREFGYLNEQARKPQEHTRSWLGRCVYFQGSGRLHGLFPSLTSTAVGWCPLQPTHARDRQPERRWQALLLAALDIFLEPWSKVGQASPQWLPQWLPATSPPAPPTVPRSCSHWHQACL